MYRKSIYLTFQYFVTVCNYCLILYTYVVDYTKGEIIKKSLTLRVQCLLCKAVVSTVLY